jgi:hypothetical protein
VVDLDDFACIASTLRTDRDFRSNRDLGAMSMRKERRRSAPFPP